MIAKNKDDNFLGRFTFLNDFFSIGIIRTWFLVNHIKSYYFGGGEYLISITSDSLGLVSLTEYGRYDWSSLSSLSN